MFSLKDWQRASLSRLLSSSSDLSSSALEVEQDGNDALIGASSWSDDWKVLILDNDTRSIIAPLLSVGELRSLAVTLHLTIDAPRDALPDVSAVYFVRPTPSNVAAIATDAAASRYRDASVHFASPVSRPVLEGFARACVESGSVSRIKKVVDQHLAYVALESRLFTLNMRSGFASYRSPSSANVNDGEGIRNFAQQTAVGLLSVFSTIGTVPVIVFQNGGPSELVARSLDELIRDHLGSPGLGAFGSLGGGGAGAAGALPMPLPGRKRPEPLGFGAGSRPVLILVDRDIDLVAPLAHSNTYQSLVDDCFGPISSNRVVIPESALPSGSSESSIVGDAASSGFFSAALSFIGVGSSAGQKKSGGQGKTVYLDADADPFWRNHAGDDYQRAVEAQENEAKDAAAREDALRQSRAALGASGLADDAAMAAQLALGSSGPDASASTLLTAINSLPELLKRKKMLEVHASILMALFKTALESRTMNAYTDLESALLQGETLDRNGVLQLCSDNAEGRVFEDRLRLAAMHLLTCPLTSSFNSSSSSSSSSAASSSSSSSSLSSSSSSVGASATPAGVLESEMQTLLSTLQSSLVGPEKTSAEATASAKKPINTMSADTTLLMKRATLVLGYVKHLRSVAAATSGGFGAGGSSQMGGFSLSQAVGGGTGGALLDAGGRLFGNILSAASSVARSAARGAARLVAGEARMPLTRVVSAICEGKPSSAPGFGLESFGVLDPRVGGRARGGASLQAQTYGVFAAQANAAATAAAAGGSQLSSNGSIAVGAASAAQSASFKNAFVFVVGGGCYGEAHDVQRWAEKAEPRRTIIYGSTDLVNGKTFLDQLESLGQETTSH
jgi:hypothetical protein